MALGDAISQFVVEGKSTGEYAVERSARFFVFGTFLAVNSIFVYINYYQLSSHTPQF